MLPCAHTTRVCCSDKPGVAEWLGKGGRRMAEEDMEAPDLVFARRVDYDLNCNWKVFCDNYLVRAHLRHHYLAASMRRA